MVLANCSVVAINSDRPGRARPGLPQASEQLFFGHQQLTPPAACVPSIAHARGAVWPVRSPPDWASVRASSAPIHLILCSHAAYAKLLDRMNKFLPVSATRRSPQSLGKRPLPAEYVFFLRR